MPSRRIVCRCEDITEEEIVKAIKRGYKDLETLKRYLGVFTGPCQGKTCQSLVIKILARETGRNIEDFLPTTERPPLKPVPLEFLVGAGDR
ncbi:MAG: (2Fe-2S)-binding protein [Methanobacteriota archaeon]|nr:MAG: (2Fe-2S)-binding protein [Euryarchaeota archaeon]